MNEKFFTPSWKKEFLLKEKIYWKFSEKIIKEKSYKVKNHHKFIDHGHYTGKYRGATDNICILKFSIPKDILMAFHNGLNYDCHFIIKELAKGFEEKFNCPGGNTQK